MGKVWIELKKKKEKKKKENLGLQRLPEVPDGKKWWRMHKEKRQPLDKEEQAFFLFQAVTSDLTTPFCCLVFGHHAYIFGRGICLSLSLSSSSLSVSIMLKYKRPTNELQTNPYQTLTNFQKKTNPYGSPKYQMRTNTYMKRLTYFWHLNWGIQPFQCIQEKLPHPWNGCWTQ